MLPADAVEELEGLVDEVDDVAAFEVEVVGRRRHHHLHQVGRARRALDGGQQGAFRPVGVAHFNEVPEPPSERVVRDRPALEGPQRDPRRLAAGVRRYVQNPLVQGGDALVALQVVAHVGHGGEDRHAVGPTGTPAAYSVEAAGPHDLVRVRPGADERHDGLGHHQPDVLVHALLEPAQAVRDRVARCRGEIDVDAAVLDFDRVDRGVVGKEIEGAAALEVESGVMPVAGQDAVLHGPAMQGEPHVRTAVVHGVEVALRVEDDDRYGSARDQGPPLEPDLLQGPRVQQFPRWLLHDFSFRSAALHEPWTESATSSILEVKENLHGRACGVPDHR